MDGDDVSVVEDRSLEGPHPDLRGLVAEHAPRLAQWLDEGSIAPEDVVVLSRRTYPGRSRYTAAAGSSRDFSTCIARVARQPVPIWPEPTDPRQTPHIDDATFVTGDLLIWAGAGQNQVGHWVLAGLSVMSDVAASGPPRPTLPVGLHLSIIAGVGAGFLVLDPRIERLRIVLADGVIYEDRVRDGVLHAHAWFDSEEARRGELRVQLLDDTGRVVQEERVTMPADAI